jgi:dihydrofolate reductase
MAKSVLYMSMSLDGFIAGPDDDRRNGLGVDGHRLHDWLSDGTDPASHRPSGVSGEVFDEVMATGAVVVGRRTFAHAGGWNGDHHDGVPIFVLSRRPPDPAMRWPAVTYVSDVATAVRLAKDAAGNKDVLVHGALTAQLALTADVLDELQIHLVPVLLGQGRRLFENLPPDHIELDLVRRLTTPDVEELAQQQVTHLRYRVRRQ